MNLKIAVVFMLLIGVMYNDSKQAEPLTVEVYQTSVKGDMFSLKDNVVLDQPTKDTLELFPEQTYQEISGFGGAFTESSAYLLNQLSESKRKEIIEAYFSESGANYSLCRTHMNSCDFSLGHYS